ncbi:hypothetical protein [Paenibacillus xylanilyticus]|nr:hypothetical protein [Paenibacillus xylanilyticus]
MDHPRLFVCVRWPYGGKIGKDINPGFNLDLLIKRWDDALKVRKMAL